MYQHWLHVDNCRAHHKCRLHQVYHREGNWSLKNAKLLYPPYRSFHVYTGIRNRLCLNILRLGKMFGSFCHPHEGWNHNFHLFFQQEVLDVESAIGHDDITFLKLVYNVWHFHQLLIRCVTPCWLWQKWDGPTWCYSNKTLQCWPWFVLAVHLGMLACRCQSVDRNLCTVYDIANSFMKFVNWVSTCVRPLGLSKWWKLQASLLRKGIQVEITSETVLWLTPNRIARSSSRRLRRSFIKVIRSSSSRDWDRFFLVSGGSALGSFYHQVTIFLWSNAVWWHEDAPAP